MSSCYEAARRYLQMGLHPIPCAARSKRPIVEWREFQEHPPHADQIDEWWERTPDANVALVLGRGTFAVDLDGGHDAETLLADRGIFLPGAPRSRTASGYHVFLSSPGPVPDRVGLLAGPKGKPAVDIRGVGIVVAPPSIHPTGAVYEWYIPLALPFPPAPQALLDLIQAGGASRQTAGPSGQGWVAEALHGAGEGTRDAICTKLAGYFIGRGLDPATVETVLIESFARNCTPPFDSADVRKCVASIARKHRAGGDGDRGLTPVSLGAVLEEWERAGTGQPAGVVAAPYPSLAKHLAGGFYPGDFVLIGARPGVGKTAMGLEIVRRAGKDGVGSLFVSREMLNLALARRIVAQEARVDAVDLRRGTVHDGQRPLIAEALPRLKRLPVYLTDQAVSIGEVQALVEGWAQAHPLGLLVVDYLQLVRAPSDIRERRHQVEAVSQALKTLATQHRIPVLCLSSLARTKGQDGRERRPTLSDLRESGELEHDADVVLLLHREFMKAETTCTIAKNRDGNLGVAELIFRPSFVSFDETADREERS